MSSDVININKLFNTTSLITRQAARELFIIISQSFENDIQLDFSNIAHASRSFFDELNSHKSKMKLLGKKVEIINLNSTLENLLIIVQNASYIKSSLPYSSIANARSINI